MNLPFSQTWPEKMGDLEGEEILHLTLKKQWFDMILYGPKDEEYRELKEYWEKRLCNIPDFGDTFKHFDIVRFKNGYGNRPWFDIEFKGTEIRTGKPEWGAVEGEKYFVIKLGKILTTPQGDK